MRLLLALPLFIGFEILGMIAVRYACVIALSVGFKDAVFPIFLFGFPLSFLLAVMCTIAVLRRTR